MLTKFMICKKEIELEKSQDIFLKHIHLKNYGILIIDKQKVNTNVFKF